MDQNAQRWFAQADEYLKLASVWREAGDNVTADQYLKEARELAKDLNQVITSMLKAQIKALDPHFADGRSWRNRPREPKAAAPTGKAEPIRPLPAFRPPSSAPGNFKLPPARLNQLAEDLKQRRGTR